MTIPRRRDGVLLQEVHDDVLAFEEASGEAFLLNPTAAAIFELCDGQRDEARIAAEIAATTGADADDVLGDVQRTVAELCDSGLLERDG